MTIERHEEKTNNNKIRHNKVETSKVLLRSKIKTRLAIL